MTVNTKIDFDNRETVEVTSARQYFEEVLPAIIKKNNDTTVRNLNYTNTFEITGGDPGTWTLIIENGYVTDLVSGRGSRRDSKIRMDGETLVAIVTGETKPHKAFFAGRVKLSGNIKTIIKLVTLLPLFFRLNPARKAKK